MSPEELQALKEELQKCLQEVGIEDPRGIEQEISASRIELSEAKRRPLIIRLRAHLVKLEQIQSLYDRVQQEEAEPPRKEARMRDELSDEPGMNDTTGSSAPQEAEATESADQTEQAELSKDRTVLEEGLRDCLKMPACCERSLIRLQCFIGLIEQDILSVVLSPEQSIVVLEGIEKEKKYLEEHLHGIKYSAEEKRLLSRIRSAIEGLDWNSAQSKVGALLKRIRPFNVREMLHLMVKGDEAAKQIEGQDIVLFLGESGTGKSTAIHYLAGTPLKEMEVNADGSIRHLQIMLSTEESSIEKWKRENESVNRTNILLVYEEKIREWRVYGKGGDGKPCHREVGSIATPLQGLLNGQDVEQAKAIDAETLLKAATQFLNCSSGMSHFEPDVSTLGLSPVLRDVTVSAAAKSETRCITAVPVEFEDVLGIKKSILLCDAPGLGDTRGAEVDVANLMSVIAAIRGCKSVRPLVFVSYLSVGDRLQGISSLAHILVNTIPKIDEYKSSFFYVFTKYPEDQEAGINAKLKSRLANMSEEDRGDPAFYSLFEDLSAKTLPDALRKRSFILDLHRKDREDFLRALMNDKVVDPIEDPAQAFHFMITEKSKSVIMEQLTRDLDSIRGAVESADYEMVKYRLDELQTLYRVLPGVEQVRVAYQEGIHLIADHINKICDGAKTQLRECLEDRHSSLSVENVRRYESCVAEVKASEVAEVALRDSSVNPESRGHQADDLMLYLSVVAAELLPVQNAQQVEHLRSQVRERIDLVKIRLDKIKFIIGYFPELQELSFRYSRVIDVLQSQFDERVEEALESVHEIVQFISDTGKMEVADVRTKLAELFSKSAEELSAIFRMEDSFSEHLTREKVGDKQERFSKELIKCLQEFRKSCTDLFEGEELKESELRLLNGWMLVMESVENAVALHAHIDLEEVRNIHQQLLGSIQKYFMGFQEKIGEYFEGGQREENLQKIGGLVSQMENIRQIPGVKEVTADSYHNTIERVGTYVRQLVEDVQGILEKLAKEEDPSEEEGDYDRLSRYLLGLRNASWMDDSCPGVRSDKLTDIVQRLTRHAQSLARAVAKVDLSLDQSVNLVKADRLMSKIEGMGKLGEREGIDIAGVLQSLNDAKEGVKQSVQRVLQNMGESFNLERASVERLKEEAWELESFKRVPREDFFTQPQYKEYESIEKLQANIARIGNEIETLMVSERNEIEKEEVVYKELEEGKQKYGELKEPVWSKGHSRKPRSKASVGESLEEATLKRCYGSPEQLDAKIKESEQRMQECKARFEKESSELEAQRRSLMEIEKEYNAIPSGEVLLGNDRYHHLDDLNSAIRVKQQEIGRCDRENCLYRFEKLDALKMVQAFSYLKQLQTCPRLMSADIEKVRADLEGFVKEYGEFIQHQMDAGYRDIVEYPGPEESAGETAEAKARMEADSFKRLFQSARDFLNRLQDVAELEQRYPEVVRCFQMTGSIAQTWSEALRQYSLDLSTEMEKLFDGNELALLQRKIFIARALHVLDDFLGKGEYENFGALHLAYQKRLDNLPAVVEEMNVDIREHRYEAIAERMNGLSQLPRQKRAYNRLRQTVAGSLKQLVEEARLHVITVSGDEVVLDAYRPVVGWLRSVRDGLKALSGHLEDSVGHDIEENVERVRELISETMINFLKTIDASINVNNFFEANKRIKRIKGARDLLDSDCSKDVKVEIGRLEARVSKMFTEVVTKYSSMDISGYSLNPPKDIFLKFKQGWEGPGGDAAYDENWKKIETAILDRIRETIEKARHAQPGEQSEVIRGLNRALQFLPPAIGDILAEEMQHLNEDIEKEKAEYETRCVDACDADNPEEIKRLLDECEGQGMRLIGGKIKEKVQDLLQKKKAEIEGNLPKLTQLTHDDARGKVFREIEKVVLYQKEFGKAIRGVDRVYSDIQAELASIFSRAVQCIESSLNCDTAMTPSEVNLTEVSFAMLSMLVENGHVVQEVVEGFRDKVQKINDTMAQYFRQNQARYADSFGAMDIQTLKKSLEGAMRWSSLAPARLQQYVAKNGKGDFAASFEKLSEVFAGSVSYVTYGDMVRAVSAKIEELKSEVCCVELFDDAQRAWLDQQREDFYKQLNSKLLLLGEVRTIGEPRDVTRMDVDGDKEEQEVLKVLGEKVNRLCDTAIKLVDRPAFLDMDPVEYDKFSAIYSSLVLLGRCITFPEVVVNVKRTVEEVKQRGLGKVEMIQREAEEKIQDMGGWKLEVGITYPSVADCRDKTFYLVLTEAEQIIMYKRGAELKSSPFSIGTYIEPGVLRQSAILLTAPIGTPVENATRPSFFSSLDYKTITPKRGASFNVNASKFHHKFFIQIPPKMVTPILVQELKQDGTIQAVHLVSNWGDDSKLSTTQLKHPEVVTQACQFPPAKAEGELPECVLVDEVPSSVYREIMLKGGGYAFQIRDVIFKDADLRQKIVAQLLEGELKLSPDTLGKDIAQCLIRMKFVANNVHIFRDDIKRSIDKFLMGFRAKGGPQALSLLGTLLNQDERGIGQTIISEHQGFQGYAISLWNQGTARHGIEYVLQNIAGNSIDLGQLRERFAAFEGEYKKLKDKHLGNASRGVFDELISSTKMIVQGVDIQDSKGKIRWDANMRKKALLLMEHVFALWTLKGARHYFEAAGLKESERETYLLQPHAAQVVSIFRLLGIGETGKLCNHLIQIGTGEGKSVTLAVAAAVLALLGCDVSCACYSDYLSRRDYESFESLFTQLGIADSIHYGTFNQLCEAMINEDGDVRERVKKLVTGEAVRGSGGVKHSDRPKILLIDEVDVFFNRSFYGNVYTPATSLQGAGIIALADLIWKKRSEPTFRYRQLQAEPEYQACCKMFAGWESLIEEAARDMLASARDFSHDYVVCDGKIGYKEQDGISFNVRYGYKTLFAYYAECEKGTVTRDNLEKYISIQVNCGNFSYAEVPNLFKYIMGVTGTLSTLSPPERKIIQEEYNIHKETYAPSVFGANNRIFREGEDIKIESKDDYFGKILEEIHHKLVGTGEGKRAVMVFFGTKERLMEFYNSPVFSASPMKAKVKVMTEEVSLKEKETIVKGASTRGHVSLFTQSFGRGTDFICYDQVVLANGGVHVVQTFLSETLSEEVQIQGRTARQGNPGSYSMVLLDQDLEKFLISAEEIDKARTAGGKKLYELLNTKRGCHFEDQYSSIARSITAAEKDHEKAVGFLQCLNAGDIEAVKKFLLDRNRGAMVEGVRSRTICLMDATGSMTSLLQKAKDTVSTMFERAYAILTSQGFTTAFEMQFAVYRNYNSLAEKILQCSSWETKPDNLRLFMDKIGAEGGWGDEAIEIGLWHVNKEAEKGEVSQVILIGDMPPNTEKHVIDKREEVQGESYWLGTKFGAPTFFKTEVAHLKDKHIRVHAFFVNSPATEKFKEIAGVTGGECNALDIHSPAGAEMLTKLVTEQVLKDVGDSSGGKGDALVAEYRRVYIG